MTKCTIKISSLLPIIALLMYANVSKADDVKSICENMTSDSTGKSLLRCIELGDKADAVTQYLIGDLYGMGIVDATRVNGVITDVKPNKEKAAYWYKKAATNGDDGSAYRVGVMYLTGNGVLVNYSEARKWLITAVRLNNPSAANELSRMYMNRFKPELTVAPNPLRAYMWDVVDYYQSQKRKDGGFTYDDWINVQKWWNGRITPKDIEKAQALAQSCIDSGFTNCDD